MNNQSSILQNADTIAVDQGLQAHMTQVYREMTAAIGITGIVSYFIGRDLNAMKDGGQTLLPEALLSTMFASPVIWAVIFAPLIMIFLMGGVMRNATPSGARSFLYLFAAVFGLSLSTIFVRYTGVMIAQAFFATAGAFAGLSLWGYTTKKDLTGWGTFLFMGIIGVLILSILNIFIGSGPLQLAISAVAVLIFAGFTAYDTQEIKNNYLAMRAQSDEASLAKLGTLGALNLFIDFVGMFQHLLHLIGFASND